MRPQPLPFTRSFERRRRAGFTLVEVMISVAILASLVALMWTSISSMFVTRDLVDERADRYQQIRITMNRMVQEIASAYMAGPTFGREELPGEESFGAGAAGDEEEGEAALAQAMSYQEPIQFGFIGRDDRLDFTSLAHQRTAEGEKAGHHAEIGYFTRSRRNEEGRIVQELVRREDVTYDDELTEGGVLYVMLPEVEGIEFEYWDPGPVELGTMEEIAQGRWVDSWDTTGRDQAGRLPPRVRLTITLPPQGIMQGEESFTTQTEIAMTEVLDF